MDILSLNDKQARDFFLSSENYCTIQLPKYFDFSDMLNQVNQQLEHVKKFENIQKDPKLYPSKYDKVNYSILSYKNNKHSYRQLQIINPYIYVHLARIITDAENWSIIKERFKEFKIDKFEISSIPHVKHKKYEHAVKISIENWYHNYEQRALDLAIDYKYSCKTDISNCYPSIYTHSISWALHGKKDAKKQRNCERLLGNEIDTYIRCMQNGQTNGLAQGSTLTDFIAELVLGYADTLIHSAINHHFKEHCPDYKILRYRDDYRIFSNNKDELESILKILQEVLFTLNLNINTNKTAINENSVLDLIKDDKLHNLITSFLYDSEKIRTRSYQNLLLLICKISKDFPNSGSVLKFLDKIYNHIKNSELKYDNLDVLVSIVADIIYNNPRTCTIAIPLLSVIIDKIKDTNHKKDILKRTINKFRQLPHIGLLELWLQRITITSDCHIKYDEPLCQLIENHNVHNNCNKIMIWNNEWVKPEFSDKINLLSICKNINQYLNKGTIDACEFKIFEY